jgi:hypothetical protein
MISKEGFWLLIDAGAQILDMDKFTLVKTWLEVNPSAPTSVFDEFNKPTVLYQQGNKKEFPLDCTS